MFEYYLLLTLLIIVLFIVISSLKIGISPMPTSKSARKIIVSTLQDSQNSTIIDLGSGFGTLAIFLAVNFPHKKVIGYELSLFAFLISQILKFTLGLKNLHFYKKDFLHQDLKNCDLVCYLFPIGMQKLEDKLFDEEINTTIISNTFAFRNIKAKEIIKDNSILKTPIYIYKT
ncbi:hypothetical protein CRU98_03750 [Arcobacter sp. CECT 8986]|uniref:methyltransferase n=1 Tax=Arcobacter sp. CECT 8986 TaxID=2044507 RepID=UPI0010098A3B|nr:methyltransferase [Arcobacter sp. CECT 8986]RXK00283.1 hypothetical protein CRU98_03750 [Arcobacter sp. CECT 8986]